jgi:HTH-type transcriptional regulator/antitoxin MqsA
VTGDACPICSKGRLHATTGRYEIELVNRSGENRTLVLPDLLREECDTCGEGFLDDTATRQLEAARRRAQGLLSPSEIRELRRGLNRTQIEMSRLLGIGEKTYCRWESGLYVQSIAFDNYLRLITELPEAVRLLDQIQNEGTELARQAPETQPVFPSLRNVSSFQESAQVFTQLMEGGLLLVARVSI